MPSCPSTLPVRVHARRPDGPKHLVPAGASETATRAIPRDITALSERLLALAPALIERLRLRAPAEKLAAVQQLVGLARRELRLEDCMRPCADEAAFVRERNRLYKAHERLRQDLREALRYFGRTGRIAAEELAPLLWLLDEVVHRRPRRRAA